MSDLVKRLRTYRAYCPNNDRSDHPITNEAAGCIEQLERENAELVEFIRLIGRKAMTSPDSKTCCRIEEDCRAYLSRIGDDNG